MAELNSADFIIIAIFTISFLIGIYRGILREMITLFTWIIAFVLAILHGKTAGQIFTFVDSESMRKILGMVTIFVSIVIIGIILKYSIFRSMGISKPSIFGRIFGAVFGLLRGGIIVVLAMLYITNANVSVDDNYNKSLLIQKFTIVVDYFDLKIPEKWQKNSKKSTVLKDQQDTEVLEQDTDLDEKQIEEMNKMLDTINVEPPVND